MFIDGLKFGEFFFKSHPRNSPVKLFQNLTSSFGEEDFLRISSCPCKKPPFTRVMFRNRSKFHSFCKGSSKEHSCQIISKSDQWFQRRRFSKDCLNKFHFVAMATKVFDGIKFCEQSLKRTSQRKFLPSLVKIGPTVWEEKMFKEIVDDARQTHITTLKAPLEHFVLR